MVHKVKNYAVVEGEKSPSHSYSILPTPTLNPAGSHC